MQRTHCSYFRDTVMNRNALRISASLVPAAARWMAKTACMRWWQSSNTKPDSLYVYISSWLQEMKLNCAAPSSRDREASDPIAARAKVCKHSFRLTESVRILMRCGRVALYSCLVLRQDRDRPVA
jgi:hypothetical protein